MTGLHYFTDWGCKQAVQGPSLIFIIWGRGVDTTETKIQGENLQGDII